MRKTISIALLISWSTGCGGGGLMIPYASIPARIEVGGGGARGTIPSPQAGGGITESDAADIFHLRLGLNPLQASTEMHTRRWDLGAGYLAQWYWPEAADRQVFHGFYLEGTYFPWSADKKESSFRLGLVGSAEIVLSDFSKQAELGTGVSLGAQLEWTDSVSTAYAKTAGGGLGSSAANIGALHGEWGIGLGLTALYRRLYDSDIFMLVLLASFRLPFGAGLLGLSN